MIEFLWMEKNYVEKWSERDNVKIYRCERASQNTVYITSIYIFSTFDRKIKFKIAICLYFHFIRKTQS